MGVLESKVDFLRIEYQARSNARGASSLKKKSLVARLPPRAHSVYHRDEIGKHFYLTFDSASSDSRFQGVELAI